MPLYVVFIDVAEAFNTVPRDGLWEVLREFETSDKLVIVIKAMHPGM